MKRKIISKISYGYVVISAIAAPWMAFADLRFLPTCIWGIGLMIATAGMFLTEQKEKAPDNWEIVQGHRKFYNIIVAEGKVIVNVGTEGL